MQSPVASTQRHGTSQFHSINRSYGPINCRTRNRERTVNSLKTTGNTCTVDRILGSISPARRSPSPHSLSHCTVTTVDMHSGTSCHPTVHSHASIAHTRTTVANERETKRRNYVEHRAKRVRRSGIQLERPSYPWRVI